MKKKENVKFLIGIIIGFLLPLGMVYAATLYAATEVSYDNSNSGTSNTNVQGAIDELYELSTHCPDGYICKKPTGADMLISKANGVDATYSDATKGEMFAFSHPATAQTGATTDYRYIGSSPNNYIKFNNETWRIIGVFDGRIKIIREERINDTSIRWDFKYIGVGSSTTNAGSNDWSDSQLMYMLNPTTYALKTGYSLDGNYIKDANGKIIYQLGCLPEYISSGSTSYSCTTNTWSLNSGALSQIDTVTYYLGGPSSTSGQTAESYYDKERSTNVYSGRPTSWTGQVGLMYPSDYGYTFAKGIDDKCYTDLKNCKTENGGTPSDSWLYKSGYKQWTVSPLAGNAVNVSYVESTGNVDNLTVASTLGVRPVAYLKPGIALKGSGTYSDPYVLAVGTEQLISKANGLDATYSNTTKGEMFAFSHPATKQTPATTDYRYIGDAPNNYITFNNEKWRIIGVVEGRIKIIRDEIINSSIWDYKKDQVGSSISNAGSNDWSDSQLMYMLNPTTYTLKSGYRLDGNYIKDANGNIIYQTGCFPAPIASGATSYSCTTNTWSLNSTALSQIDTVTYYLGGRTKDSTTNFGTTDEMYAWERGTTVYSGRPTTWQGKVGLMYPSDYGYTFAKGIDNTCYTDLTNCKTANGGTPSASWLYKGKGGYTQWTVSPDAGHANYVLIVAGSGYVSYYNEVNPFGVHPVAYLKPEIALKGSGTSSDPYVIVAGTGPGTGTGQLISTEQLISKANGLDATYSTGNIGEMFAFSHDATSQTPATTDYRYIGSSPNNYIIFNNNETWRIIGVFDGRIKIIRDERINSSYWDYKQDQVGSSWSNYGSNDWSDSQVMYMLNPTTYTLKSGYSLNGNYIKDANGNIIYQVGCRPASITSGATSYSCATNTWSLNSTALSQIDTVTYYLGGPNSTSSNKTIEDIYTAERSSNVPTGRPTSWQGKVGLMYPSDYGYTFAKGVDDSCSYNLYGCNYGNPSWLYKSSYEQWTILPYPGEMMKVFYVGSGGGVGIYWPNYNRGIRPVAYLRSDIKLTGTGASTDPYRIAN